MGDYLKRLLEHKKKVITFISEKQMDVGEGSVFAGKHLFTGVATWYNSTAFWTRIDITRWALLCAFNSHCQCR